MRHKIGDLIMGRLTVFRKGAMSVAERQRRHGLG